MRHFWFPANYKGKNLKYFGIEQEEEGRYSEHDGCYKTLVEKTNYCPNCNSRNTFVFRDNTDKWLCFDCFEIFIISRDTERRTMEKLGQIAKDESRESEKS